MELKLWILQGLPGSGKSTLAKQLAGENGQVFSADDYFLDDKGNYNFNAGEIQLAHWWNNERIKDAIQWQVPVVVIDNTSVTMEDLGKLKPLILEAKKYGYNIEIQRPTTPWAFDVDELTKRNTHGVPKEVIQDRLNNFAHNATIDDILSLPE